MSGSFSNLAGTLVLIRSRDSVSIMSRGQRSRSQEVKMLNFLTHISQVFIVQFSSKLSENVHMLSTFTCM